MQVSVTARINASLMVRIRAAMAAAFLALTVIALPASAQYDLTVNMTNFVPTHQGQLFRLRVVDSSNGRQVAEYELQKIEEGDFSTLFNNILYSGKTYYIDAFADYNNNHRYDPPPVDHAWRIVISKVASDTTVALVHNADWTDIMYPNPGDPMPQPEPGAGCSCDLNGDGASNVMDVLEWLNQVRSGADNACLDYNQDGKVAISDLVRLLVAIRAGGCM